jgi:hypothetical protein
MNTDDFCWTITAQLWRRSTTSCRPAPASNGLASATRNRDGLLLPGMYVSVRLVEGTERAMLVPQRAVGRDERGNATAMVVGKNNIVEQRMLETSRILAYAFSAILVYAQELVPNRVGTRRTVHAPPFNHSHCRCTHPHGLQQYETAKCRNFHQSNRSVSDEAWRILYDDRSPVSPPFDSTEAV